VVSSIVKKSTLSLRSPSTTSFTLLFIEHAYGRDEFVDGLRRSRQTVLDFDVRRPDYRVVHENLDDMSQVTTAMTCQKGGWVLHMLRRRLGDDRFWSGIRTYYRRHQNANASTDDFRRAMEEASGENLAGFFDQWLYRGGVPRLAGTWSFDPAAQTVMRPCASTTSSRDVQPAAPFRVGVDVAMEMPGAGEPIALVLDPNVRLLASTELTRR
jgi:aminopeptidase N